MNTPGFDSREGWNKMIFKSRDDPKFTFIKVPEFDLRRSEGLFDVEASE